MAFALLSFEQRSRALMGLLSKVLTLVILLGSSSVFAGESVRIDSQVLQELQDSFRSYDKLSMSQYLALKKAKNPGLKEAQTNLSQYLQSTVTELLPPPGRASYEDIQRAFELRKQFFASPVMVQTGFEIIAHELLKPAKEVQCHVVVNTLRFISLGADPTGRKAPGLDYLRNQLLVIHLYAAYLKNLLPDSLPCQREINEQVAVRPELYEQYHDGCPPESDGQCELDRSRYMDAETTLGLMKMARAFNGPKMYEFNGALKSEIRGVFKKYRVVRAEYRTSTYFDLPVPDRRSVGVLFSYEKSHITDSTFNSVVTYEPVRFPLPVITASLVPKMSSLDVFQEYSLLAEGFLK